MESLYVSRKRHPNKEVEAALEELESMGWSQGTQRPRVGFRAPSGERERDLSGWDLLPDVDLEHAESSRGARAPVVGEGQRLRTEG